jgi:hypothetical protein
LKQHKLWFVEKYLGFLDQKQAKMQWTHDPSQSNANNLNDVRRDTGRHFRKKRRHI